MMREAARAFSEQQIAEKDKEIARLKAERKSGHCDFCNSDFGLHDDTCPKNKTTDQRVEIDAQVTEALARASKFTGPHWQAVESHTNYRDYSPCLLDLKGAVEALQKKFTH